MKAYGLALAGGGAKGAYQFGVWKALRELKIPIQGVVGTSIGALNGAAIIQDDYETLYELWHNLKASYVLNISDEVYNKIRNVDFSSTTFSALFEEVKKTIELDGLDISPLKELIESFVDERKIRESGMDFGLVTVSITDLEALELFVEDIPENHLKEYLLATAYLPFFKRERLHGKYYLDGMYHNNLPTNMLVEKGYTDIIEVHLKKKDSNRETYGEAVNIIEIKPSEFLGRALDFDQENSRKNIELGYYDTMRVFKVLEGHYYYFHHGIDTTLYIQGLLNLGLDVITHIYDVLGLWSSPHPRGMFEEIIPEMIKGLDLKKDLSYHDFILAVYEYLGQLYALERYKIYSFDVFVEEVYRQACLNKNKDHEEHALEVIKKIFSKEQKMTMALEILVCELGIVE